VGKLDGIALVLLGQFKPFLQLLLERAIAHLLQDICVPRLVDFECFVAVGADDFMHVGCFRFSFVVVQSVNRLLQTELGPFSLGLPAGGLKRLSDHVKGYGFFGSNLRR
jgi:hypothetical protein